MKNKIVKVMLTVALAASITVGSIVQAFAAEATEPEASA